jgi:hypothetical protein
LPITGPSQRLPRITRTAARTKVFDCIVLLDRRRRHSTLGYVSPAKFESQDGEAA